MREGDHVESRLITPDDLDACTEWSLVHSRAIARDTPWHCSLHPRRVQWMASRELGAPELRVHHVDGVAVAVSQLQVGYWANQDVATGEVMVDPEHRRMGLGTQVIRGLEKRAEGLSCRRLVFDGRDLPATREFADRNGYAVDLAGLARCLHLSKVDWDDFSALLSSAATQSADYEFLRLSGPTPAEFLPGLVEVFNALKDAPVGAAPLEEDVFNAERIHSTERHYSGPENRFWQIIARHRRSGELVGHTVVVVDSLTPTHAEQHETSVKRKHRGHRLGLRLKAEMLALLQAEEPQLEAITTWNAKSNVHMGRVNDELGFEVMSEWIDVQRGLC